MNHLTGDAMDRSDSDTVEKPGNVTTTKNQMYIPGIGYIPNNIRNHFVAFIGEFFGTFMFFFMAFAAAQIANLAASQSIAGDSAAQQKFIMGHKANIETLMYIALGFGFSLAVNAWAFFRISGGLFNPAVAMALAIVGVIGPVRAIVVTIAELVGGIAAAYAVSGLFPGALDVTTHLNATTGSARGVCK